MEPIMTIAAVFAGAQAAVKGVRQAVQLGKEVRDCYHEIRDFFHAQGQIEIEYKKTAEVQVKPENKRSVTEQALDIVFMRREMFKMEVELREMLIYGFNESGLYDEMCQERTRIIEAEKHAIEEAQLKARAEIDRKRRQKAKRRESIETAVAIVIAVFLSIGSFYGIWWMFQQGGQW